MRACSIAMKALDKNHPDTRLYFKNAYYNLMDQGKKKEADDLLLGAGFTADELFGQE
jgi:hypothetical protein